MSDNAYALGRAFLAVVFIVFGFIQFTNIGTYIANPTVIKVAGYTGILTPTVIAYLVAAIDLIGGILILIGYQTRWATIVLLAFVVLTMIFAHNFWTMDGPPRAANQAHFYKNLALIGGLLLLLTTGPGRVSLDARMSRS
jgi:putative oxidoreductase